MPDPHTDWRAKALELEYMLDQHRRKVGKALADLQGDISTVRVTVVGLKHEAECLKRERDNLITCVRDLFGKDVTFGPSGEVHLGDTRSGEGDPMGDPLG